MFKKLSVIVLCTFLFTPAIYACDPLGCLFGGNDQDTLILGEVVSHTETEREVKILFVFPQNHVESIKEENQITVRNLAQTINLTEEESKAITTGKKYLMSLNAKGDFYVPAWGIHEITGTKYQDARLVKVESIEDEALEIFINSCGTEQEFGFDYGGDRPVLILNGVRQESKTKENNTLWYSTGIGALVLIGGIVIILRRRK